jgi:2-polyprenyl-3-methyl-5-hydroxy-6-metoxy-1,4-benzoquinol methylase
MNDQPSNAAANATIEQPCKICGSVRLVRFAHTARCRDCGVLLYYPYPEDLGSGQACWDLTAALKWYAKAAFLNHSNFTEMVRFALDSSCYGREISVLDYGGGGGQFACVVKSHFPEANVYITDVSDEALLPHYRPFNRQIRFHEFESDPTRFDCIFLNDVFEHVTDPARVLRTLAGKLREGGTIFVDTPRTFWLYAVTRLAAPPLYRKLLRGTVSRAHLQIWTRNSFQRVIDGAGLRLVRYRQLSEYTMPAGYYLKNMGITNPVVRALGRVFYSTARYHSKNKIAALLAPARYASGAAAHVSDSTKRSHPA